MDWIAGILELLGSWIIGNKNKSGFILSFLCCLCWIYVAFDKQVYGLLITVIPSLFVITRNYLKWKKDEDRQRDSC